MKNLNNKYKNVLLIISTQGIASLFLAVVLALLRSLSGVFNFTQILVRHLLCSTSRARALSSAGALQFSTISQYSIDFVSRVRVYSKIFVIVGFFTFVIFGGVSVHAVSISEDFKANDSYPNGSIVSLTKASSDQVELSNTNNTDYLLGVVNDPNQSAISFDKNETDVSVALRGDVKVLVSNVNGEIVQGDFITTSWLDGVGMKASADSQQKIIGVAQEDFDLSQATEYGDIDTPSGKQKVSVDTVLVRLSDKEGTESTLENKNSVEEAFSEVIGQDVSLDKIIIGSLLFVMSLTVSGMFTISSIKGSFISIGRNPMASTSINKGMVRVAIISTVILLTGTVVAYAVMVL